jgi:hypothetical protein
MTQHMKNPAMLVVAFFVAIFIFCSFGTAKAQLFPRENDTIKVSPWSWAYQSIGFYGYTPMNTTSFNAVMEKNGYGRLSNWQFGVGLGGSVWRGNWNVSLYGYFGITPQERGSSTRFNSLLTSFGVEEYIRHYQS